MNPIQSLLALAGAAPTQDNRLIELHTVLGADVLVAERVEIDEGIAPHPVALAGADAGRDEPPATGYRMVVHALSVDAHIELKQLIGQPALVELLTSHSRTALRPWHGHITRAAMVGSDGGLARYRLVIEPWLGFLAHRQVSKVFQGQTVRQIVEEVFADYQAQGRLAPAWRWEIADDTVYPTRSLCTQYQESDLQFVQRLLREEGLFHWFEHSGAAHDPSLGVHTLVIADHNGAFTPNTQADVRYTQCSVALKEDSLTRWQRTARLQTSAVQLASPDYRSLGLRETMQTGVGTVIPELLLDDIPGAYTYEDAAQGERLALRQMQAIDALRFQVRAQASVRTTSPGSTFTLSDHPVHDGSDDTRDRFVTLRVCHRARNNLQADAKAAVAQAIDRVAAPTERPGRANDSTEPLYTCHLVAQPAAIAVRGVPLDEDGLPDPRLHPRPTIHGVQTAVVVGLGEPVHTDRDHRVKLQFHWQRGARASHRLNAPTEDNAPASDASGTWVRVAESVAGANWGSHFIPRLGQEVLVSFIEGDIDRPVVIGSLYNGGGQTDAQGNRIPGGAATATGNANAWFPGDAAHGDLQAHRHAAVLAGYKTQELASSQSGAGGYNQLVFDDTPGGNRIELSTTTARTRLQLGHLLNQSDNQRLQPRGHGIDLATAAWGAVRAGSGLLLSAHGRSGSQSSGHQIDSREPQAALERSSELVRSLADSAKQQNATLAADSPDRELAAQAGFRSGMQSLAVIDASTTAHEAIAAGLDSEVPSALEEVFDEQLRFVNAIGTPLPGVRYSIEMGDGTIHEGMTDGDGRTGRIACSRALDLVSATLTAPEPGICCTARGAHDVADPPKLRVPLDGIATNQVLVGSSSQQVAVPNAQSRPMTGGEIAMARRLFGSSIDYAKVVVHRGEYLWFGLQPDNTAMTPNGEMYFPAAHFREDFSREIAAMKQWFMHEMAHVWQYQLGYPVKLRGAFRLGLSYTYELDKRKRLADYNMEAQGDLLADYFALKHLGDPTAMRQGQYAGAIELYETVLRDFLADPGNPANLP